jgi:hypothetical protein
MAGLLGSGDLYINRKVDGVSQGLLLIGNATQFEITESSEVKERTSKQRETYGQVLDTVYIKQPTMVKIALDEMNKDNLAMALLGSVATFSETEGAVVGESVTVGALGNWVNVSASSLTSDAVTVKDETDTTTYVEGTDYEVNKRLGMIRPLAGGGISQGDVILVSYTGADVTGSVISGAVQPQIEAEIMLDGRNLADGTPMQVMVDRAVMAPTSPVDFLSDDWTTLELEGRALTVEGKTSPYSTKFIGA